MFSLLIKNSHVHCGLALLLITGCFGKKSFAKRASFLDESIDAEIADQNFPPSAPFYTQKGPTAPTKPQRTFVYGASTSFDGRENVCRFYPLPSAPLRVTEEEPVYAEIADQPSAPLYTQKGPTSFDGRENVSGFPYPPPSVEESTNAIAELTLKRAKKSNGYAEHPRVAYFRWGAPEIREVRDFALRHLPQRKISDSDTKLFQKFIFLKCQNPLGWRNQWKEILENNAMSIAECLGIDETDQRARNLVLKHLVKKQVTTRTLVQSMCRDYGKVYHKSPFGQIFLDDDKNILVGMHEVWANTALNLALLQGNGDQKAWRFGSRFFRHEWMPYAQISRKKKVERELVRHLKPNRLECFKKSIHWRVRQRIKNEKAALAFVDYLCDQGVLSKKNAGKVIYSWSSKAAHYEMLAEANARRQTLQNEDAYEELKSDTAVPCNVIEGDFMSPGACPDWMRRDLSRRKFA